VSCILFLIIIRVFCILMNIVWYLFTNYECIERSMPFLWCTLLKLAHYNQKISSLDTHLKKKVSKILNFRKIVQIWAKIWVSGTIGEQHKFWTILLCFGVPNVYYTISLCSHQVSNGNLSCSQFPQDLNRFPSMFPKNHPKE